MNLNDILSLIKVIGVLVCHGLLIFVFLFLTKNYKRLRQENKELKEENLDLFSENFRNKLLLKIHSNKNENHTDTDTSKRI